MPFSGMWLRVALVGADVSEELIASLLRVEVVTSSLILSTPKMEALWSSKTSVLTQATRRHIPEDGILHIRFLSPG
jgi:hypothetical protein